MITCRTSTVWVFAIAFLVCATSEVAVASVESSMMAIQGKLINQILPLAAILGLVASAFSFFTGNPNAKNHLWLSIGGAVIGFGAPSIISFIQGLVH